jgi:predicted NBD/HSP70 family sugar kinase
MSSHTHISSDVLTILREGEPRTKSQLAALTGQARSTVSLQLKSLAERGLVRALDEAVSTGGRPSTLYSFSREAGLVLVADLDVTHGHFAVTDLSGEVLTSDEVDLLITDGPIPSLKAAVQTWDEQLAALGRQRSQVRCIGVGLPGPVEHVTGRPINPPIMPLWNDFDVVGHLRDEYGAPVLVDNDVNIMAMGEMVDAWKGETDLLVVKVATGIGAGIISGGHLVRGALGAAGDIGHIQIHGPEDRLCRCGQLGCLEAFASGRGLAQTLAEQGLDATETADVVALVKAGDPHATRAVREAGRLLGEVLAACVSVLNPNLIMLGGELAEVGEPLLAGVREAIYGRTQPLLTRQLRIGTVKNREFVGLLGAARLALDELVFG